MSKLKVPAITSPFLHPGPLTYPSALSILHLKRDLLLPTVLLPPSAPTDGYAEGPVTNTRFGSFPHSTLIDIPWGSQVRASAVDTGSRGRKRKRSPVSPESQPQEDADRHPVIKQLKLEEADTPQNIEQSTTVRGGKSAQKGEEQKQKQDARQGPSGFIHILPLTPESWTLGLPHRTQVVYTPDYSYILHKLRVRPGTRIIEAGAGSGSFTHAAARAVFGPTSSTSTSPSSGSLSKSNPKADDGGVDATIPTTAAAQEEQNDNHDEVIDRGRVHSYEFHAQRHEKLVTEIDAHGLSHTVTLHLRDVCTSGFLGTESASAVFLDLPAPWLALPHLTRSSPSPLDPAKAVRICTFSPCIEQVDRTISTLRRLGWVDIEMSAIAARRIEVRREKVGVGFAGRKGERGISGHPCDVGEAVGRGREVEERGRKYHERVLEKERRKGTGKEEEEEEEEEGGEPKTEKEMAMKGAVKIPAYKEGRLVTRSESEMKEHTSYLVFAVLPMAWTEEDEARAAEKAAQMGKEAGEEREMSRAMEKKARKRAAKEAAAEGRNKGEDEAEAVGDAGKPEGEGEGDDVGDVKIQVERDGAASVDEGGDVKMEEAEGQSL